MKEYHRRFGYFLVNLFTAGGPNAELDLGPARVMKNLKRLRYKHLKTRKSLIVSVRKLILTKSSRNIFSEMFS